MSEYRQNVCRLPWGSYVYKSQTDLLKRWMDNLAAMEAEVIELAPEMSWVGTRPKSLAQGGRLRDAAGK